MTTTTLAPTTLAPSVRHWLPGAYRPIGAACSACGAFESLVYSAGDAYVCCLWCGWQRRLITDADRLQAALGQVSDWPHWPQVLARLAKAAPDPLPPVAALLWRQTGPATWQGPSRSTPDTTYTVEYTGRRVKCSCPNLNTATCWHKLRARELGCTDPTATDDLFG